MNDAAYQPQPYTVIGQHGSEHPDYTGQTWICHISGADAEDASRNAVAEMSGVVVDQTPVDEWILRMESTYAVAVVPGHVEVVRADAMNGEFVEFVARPDTSVLDVQTAAAAQNTTPAALALGH